MDLYKEYPAHIVFMRRAFAVVAGVLALPVMLFWKDRARFTAICTASGQNQREAGMDGSGRKSDL